MDGEGYQEDPPTMQVNVVGRHMSLGDDQTAHAEAEAEKLGKFFDGINEVTVTFNREHDDITAEIVCAASGGKTLVAAETGRTIHESLEFASDNMARQIKKYKEKLHDRRAHGVVREEREETDEDEEEYEDLAEEA